MATRTEVTLQRLHELEEKERTLQRRIESRYTAEKHLGHMTVVARYDTLHKDMDTLLDVADFIKRWLNSHQATCGATAEVKVLQKTTGSPNTEQLRCAEDLRVQLLTEIGFTPEEAATKTTLKDGLTRIGKTRAQAQAYVDNLLGVLQNVHIKNIRKSWYQLPAAALAAAIHERPERKQQLQKIRDRLKPAYDAVKGKPHTVAGYLTTVKELVSTLPVSKLDLPDWYKHEDTEKKQAEKEALLEKESDAWWKQFKQRAWTLPKELTQTAAEDVKLVQEIQLQVHTLQKWRQAPQLDVKRVWQYRITERLERMATKPDKETVNRVLGNAAKQLSPRRLGHFKVPSIDATLVDTENNVANPFAVWFALKDVRTQKDAQLETNRLHYQNLRQKWPMLWYAELHAYFYDLATELENFINADAALLPLTYLRIIGVETWETIPWGNYPSKQEKVLERLFQDGYFLPVNVLAVTRSNHDVIKSAKTCFDIWQEAERDPEQMIASVEASTKATDEPVELLTESDRWPSGWSKPLRRAVAKRWLKALSHWAPAGYLTHAKQWTLAYQCIFHAVLMELYPTATNNFIELVQYLRRAEPNLYKQADKLYEKERKTPDVPERKKLAKTVRETFTNKSLGQLHVDLKNVDVDDDWLAQWHAKGEKSTWLPKKIAKEVNQAVDDWMALDLDFMEPPKQQPPPAKRAKLQANTAASDFPNTPLAWKLPDDWLRTLTLERDYGWLMRALYVQDMSYRIRKRMFYLDRTHACVDTLRFLCRHVYPESEFSVVIPSGTDLDTEGHAVHAIKSMLRSWATSLQTFVFESDAKLDANQKLILWGLQDAVQQIWYNRYSELKTFGRRDPAEIVQSTGPSREQVELEEVESALIKRTRPADYNRLRTVNREQYWGRWRTDLSFDGWRHIGLATLTPRLNLWDELHAGSPWNAHAPAAFQLEELQWYNTHAPGMELLAPLVHMWQMWTNEVSPDLTLGPFDEYDEKEQHAEWFDNWLKRLRTDLELETVPFQAVGTRTTSVSQHWADRFVSDLLLGKNMRHNIYIHRHLLNSSLFVGPYIAKAFRDDTSYEWMQYTDKRLKHVWFREELAILYSVNDDSAAATVDEEEDEENVANAPLDL